MSVNGSNYGRSAPQSYQSDGCRRSIVQAGDQADLLAIVDYISDDNPDAAQRLKDDIETKAAKLPERPRLCRRSTVRAK